MLRYFLLIQVVDLMIQFECLVGCILLSRDCFKTLLLLMKFLGWLKVHILKFELLLLGLGFVFFLDFR